MIVTVEEFDAFLDGKQYTTNIVATPAAAIEIYKNNQGDKLGLIAMPSNGDDRVYEIFN